jgi:hypothetical protein
MSVLDLMQVLGFGLTCFIAGYSLGNRNDRHRYEVSPKS